MSRSVIRRVKAPPTRAARSMARAREVAACEDERPAPPAFVAATMSRKAQVETARRIVTGLLVTAKTPAERVDLETVLTLLSP